MTITLTVAGRIATVEADGHVVAGNTYPMALSLDSEWTGSLYLRVRFGSLYYDLPFASSATSVDVQFPVGYPEVGIGVFSEALEICTNEARVRLLRSILEAGEQVVEFDSDLYDQWAGEVTTLLTDDAFDAESTRPVQNAVLTAWKNTVPLDSALVHKTGNEEINGIKTFTNVIVQSRASACLINMNSALSNTAEGFRGEIAVKHMKDGSPVNVSQIISRVYNAYNQWSTRVYNKAGSNQYEFAFRNHEDHCSMHTTPYYPVDGQGNPLALSADIIPTSGNIAVDPRLVHTSGIETIAGEKTLLTAPVVSASESGIIFLSDRSESSNQRITTLKFADATNPRNDPLSQFAVGRTAQYNYAISYLKKGTANHSVTFRAHADHMDVAVTPYYPVDGSGNPQALTANALVASGNLAVDPRLVHTTGNETVAGVKTFAKPASLAMHESSSNNLWGWRKMLVSPSFSNQNDVNMCIFELTDNTGHHARFQLRGCNASLSGISMIFGNYDPTNVKVSRSSDGEIIVWSRAYRVLATLVYEVHAGSNSVTFVDSGTTAIFDEPTTDTYAQVIQPSN